MQGLLTFQAWESRYVLLLWLSMACMIPFDLSRLDSNVKLEGGDVKKPVMDRILDIGKVGKLVISGHI